MEHLNAEVKDSLHIPDTVKSADLLDDCNLLKCDNEVAATGEELYTNIGADIQAFPRRCIYQLIYVSENSPNISETMVLRIICLQISSFASL